MLPAGWRLRLDAGVRRIDGGRVLVGGAPLRILRLTEAGAAVVDRLADGEPVGGRPGPQQLARRLLDAGVAHPVPDPHGAGLGPDDVTVVVPTYPSPQGLSATLASLGPTAGCIVVDDASPVEGIAAVAAEHGARCERHVLNGGPAAARNTGWRLASTDVLAFVDPGCTPEPGWLEALLPHFDDPEVAAVAPRITTSVQPSLPAALAAYEGARPSLDRGPAPAPVRPRSRVPFVPSTTLLVRRSALEALGGFDEDLRFGEDVDLVWRLVAAGHTVRYEPSAEVAHPSRGSASAWLRQRFGYGTSAAPLATRHGAAVAPVALSRWTLAAWGLAGAGAPLAGAGVAAATSALLVPKLRDLERPWSEAARLAGLGHLYGGRLLADAVRRPWWPLAVGAALVSRRARRTAIAVVTVPLLLEWWQERPGLDPATWVVVRLADDVAYGAGVWAGCWRERSLSALAPDLTAWPGRRAAVEPG